MCDSKGKRKDYVENKKTQGWVKEKRLLCEASGDFMVRAFDLLAATFPRAQYFRIATRRNLRLMQNVCVNAHFCGIGAHDEIKNTLVKGLETFAWHGGSP